MKKELAIHLFCFIIFFLLITFFKRFFSPIYILFWVGGLIGTILPDIDHLIYVYFLQPHELTSQRAQSSLQKGDYRGTVTLLASTANERTNLIFHSAWFQILFYVITFWVVSSTSSYLGKGVVIAFCLHLLVDQYEDLMQKGSIDSWFTQVKVTLSREKAVFYCIFLLLVLVLFSIFL